MSERPAPIEQLPLSRSFGYQTVDALEREQRIRRVFEAVAPRYDLMNDLMSFGIHRWWKRALVRIAAPTKGQCIVDVAGGTGDVAALMAGPDRQVIVIDPSTSMMDAGRSRHVSDIEWRIGTAEQLPLPDASVDTLTIAFGIRNATHVDLALAEAWRVLRPGGRFLCLEFSTPASWLRPFYNAFSFVVIPRLGAWIARSPEAYTYLVESIRKFPNQRVFQEMVQATGFVGTGYKNLSGGIACIHQGTKPAGASTRLPIDGASSCRDNDQE